MDNLEQKAEEYLKNTPPCNYHITKKAYLDGLADGRKELDYYNRYYWDHRGCLSSYYIKKEYFNTLTEVKNTDCKEILRCFDKTAIFINNKLYTDNEGLEFLKEIEEEHKPFVIKGTDWPYWFKIDGLLCHSETSNYFLFLDHEYDYLAESSLEEYNGPDKYSEHKNKEE